MFINFVKKLNKKLNKKNEVLSLTEMNESYRYLHN